MREGMIDLADTGLNANRANLTFGSQGGSTIRAVGLHKSYETQAGLFCALENVSFDIGSGEFVAIMGQSGSGKSTLLNLIGCLDAPSKGSLLIDGTDVTQSDLDELSSLRNRRIGFVFQAFNLLPNLTALENVALPLVYAGISRRARLERAEKNLRILGLGDRVHHLPAQLSGGQQQRVAIARALINSPAIICADEPTGALDSRNSLDVMRLLRQLAMGGVTVVMVTHDTDLAEWCDRTIVLRDGQIFADRAANAANIQAC